MPRHKVCPPEDARLKVHSSCGCGLKRMTLPRFARMIGYQLPDRHVVRVPENTLECSMASAWDVVDVYELKKYFHHALFAAISEERRDHVARAWSHIRRQARQRGLIW